MQAKRYSYSCKQNFNERTTLFNIFLLQQRRVQTRQTRPFSQRHSRSCSGDAFWPRQGFFAELSASSTAAKSGAEGTRWYQAARQRGGRRCQAPLRVSCLVADGEAFPAASQPAQPRHWPEGKCWLQQLWRSVWKRGNKNGETWKASPAKRDKHTHTTHK